MFSRASRSSCSQESEGFGYYSTHPFARLSLTIRHFAGSRELEKCCCYCSLNGVLRPTGGRGYHEGGSVILDAA